MPGWKNSVYNSKQIPSSDTSQLGCSNPRQLCLRNKMRIPYWWPSHPCSLDITILQSSRHSAFHSFKSWYYYIHIFLTYLLLNAAPCLPESPCLMHQVRSRPFWCWSLCHSPATLAGCVWNKPQRAATTLGQIAWHLLRTWQWWFHWNGHGIMSCNQWLKRSYMLLAEQLKSNKLLQCKMMHLEMGMNMCGCAAVDVRTRVAYVHDVHTYGWVHNTIKCSIAHTHNISTYYIALYSRWPIAKSIIKFGQACGWRWDESASYIQFITGTPREGYWGASLGGNTCILCQFPFCHPSKHSNPRSKHPECLSQNLFHWSSLALPSSSVTTRFHFWQELLHQL